MENVATCHSEGLGLPEESAFLLSFAKKRIPRFARFTVSVHRERDEATAFFRNMFGLGFVIARAKIHRLKPVLLKNLAIGGGEIYLADFSWVAADSVGFRAGVSGGAARRYCAGQLIFCFSSRAVRRGQ